MNLYSNKQRWKTLLILFAMIIAGASLWYTNHIASKIEKEERSQIEMWSNSIVSRAQLVQFAEKLFNQLKEEERKEADFMTKSFFILLDPKGHDNLTFFLEYIASNTTIPVLVYNAQDSLFISKNIDKSLKEDPIYMDSLKNAMGNKNKPIIFPEVGHTVYYDDSRIFTELKDIMDDLINSFVSETVMNSGSIPVAIADSSQTRVINYHNVDSVYFATEESTLKRLKQMKSNKDPIAIELPGIGKQYIYYEDSLILTQLKFFPIFQLILIGVFLMGSYLIFSTYRKAEQNQVWVGMAKETAHQLGTPLSSLMAWVALLKEMGVDENTIEEINKDVIRLETITDRFSKIGSKPELKPLNIVEVVEDAINYLSNRISSKIEINIHFEEREIYAGVNVPLFGWVLENLIKNAADAMEGKGKLDVSISESGGQVIIDVKDSGKGMTKANFKNVFQPGFTTKKRGWGLGLSLTKRIIENYHQGKIFVKESETNQGTTFRILLNQEIE